MRAQRLALGDRDLGRLAERRDEHDALGARAPAALLTVKATAVMWRWWKWRWKRRWRGASWRR
jgi:hypothetical protein